jgi:hypothetical protein
MTIFSLVLLAVVSVLCNIFGALILKICTRIATGFKLSYFSAYPINFWVTYLYLTAYHFLGLFGYLAMKEHARFEFNVHILFMTTVGLLTILPFFISSIIYAGFIYHPDTYCRIGFAKGFRIALLNAAVTVPTLLAIAFLHSFMPAH